jgi:hypothetical protein
MIVVPSSKVRCSKGRRTIVPDAAHYRRAAPAQLKICTSVGADTADRVAPEAVIIRSLG